MEGKKCIREKMEKKMFAALVRREYGFDAGEEEEEERSEGEGKKGRREGREVD